MSTLFSWEGVNEAGQPVHSRSLSDTKTSLKLALYQQKIVARKIVVLPQRMISLRRWTHSKQTLFFLAQLHSLLNIGLNLSKAVSLLNQNRQNSMLSELVHCLKHDLSHGQQLSGILRKFPELFDQIILQLIQSGETTGRIDLSILQAFEYYEQKQKALSQLLTALLYPAILLLVSLGVLLALILFVIPQFEAIYSQSKGSLPALTVFILTVSDWVTEHFIQLCLGALGISAALQVTKQIYQFQLIDHLPVIRTTIKKVNTLRFCQTLTGLYSAGLTITDCLNACRDLSTSKHYRLAINQTLEGIENGHSLSDALKSSQYFNHLLIQLIKTGEESANLTNMLEQCSHYYNDQLNSSFDRLKIMLEPILIVTLGAVIGVILIAMYLPVFNLGSSF